MRISRGSLSKAGKRAVIPAELESWKNGIGGGEAGTVVARDGRRRRLGIVGLSGWSVDIILTLAAAEFSGKAPVLMLFAARQPTVTNERRR